MNRNVTDYVDIIINEIIKTAKSASASENAIQIAARMRIEKTLLWVIIQFADSVLQDPEMKDELDYFNEKFKNLQNFAVNNGIQLSFENKFGD